MINIEESTFELESFDNNDTGVLIIGKSGNNQLHAGILHKQNGTFKILHLAFHSVLKNDDLQNYQFKDYYWIKSNIHSSRQKSLSALCRKILDRDKTQKIPYGVLFEKGAFTKDGKLELGNNMHGLTCSTFILSIFEEAKIKLIDISTWIPRESDKNWHLKIVETLEYYKDRYKISDEHIENVRNENGCARYRPEEVVISSAFTNRPITMRTAEEAGGRLKGFLPYYQD